ncbi:Hypothetical Protein FCC1311_025702 [Hondaea fermentalgiana]|uniref:Uncharacterized protein n=1 Tax=Hondaea fermentalgiana TaxID=2315210 RepID=A0A2R5G7P6_9STRA|nr:Hypothetical Protein FCC1311_025702 [Hondaea fermentalgiana]|eukprot:GBG26349.1 Hypothetical Protein FCC1311_025702 [Hondaea fermentalgiana]
MEREAMELDALLDEVDLAHVLQNLVRDRREELRALESAGAGWSDDIAHGDNLGHGIIDVFEDFQHLVETRLKAELDALGWSRTKFLDALRASELADNLVLIEATSDIQAFSRILVDEIAVYDKVAEETQDLW